MPSPIILLDGLMFPEGPRWHEGRLWFSDMHAHQVVAVDMAGKRETIVEVPNKPSGLGWLPDGRLLVVSMQDRKLLRLDPGGLVEHADLSGIATFDCNDMVTGPTGNSYVGNFGFDLHNRAEFKAASLALAIPDGQVRAVAGDLMFPNGTVITPDGSTLIVGESGGQRLTAFDIEADGSLSNRRTWAETGNPPDGICLDAEGCIWVAVPRGNVGVIRVAEGGEIKQQIPTERDAFACMLGGPEGCTLLICEAFGSNPEGMKPGNGCISMVEVDAPGAGWP
jgi:sugar lactone lactonase YvrE